MTDPLNSMTALRHLATKKQVSMTTTSMTQPMASVDSLQEMKTMKADIEKAFSLMQEVRGRLEEAYQQLSK